MRELSDGERDIQREAQREWRDAEDALTRACDQCGAPMNPVAVVLGPTCGTCCRENHARVTRAVQGVIRKARTARKGRKCTS